MSLCSIVRIIREHFCSTKTDSSDAKKIMMENLTNAQHVKKSFTHPRDLIDTLKVLIKGLSTGATHKLVKYMSS